MAEGLLRSLGGKDYDVYSAGTNPTVLNPLAIEAMDEVGLDISGQKPEGVERYVDQPFDLVITVCDRARENCPLFPNARNMLHWGFDDPADAGGTEEERRVVFRRVRDEIEERVSRYLSGRVRKRNVS